MTLLLSPSRNLNRDGQWVLGPAGDKQVIVLKVIIYT